MYKAANKTRWFWVGLRDFVRTTKPVDCSWDMRSFKIVERAYKKTKSRERLLEAHIKEECAEYIPTGVVQGVDVGGKHIATTVDTDSQHEILWESRYSYSVKTRKGRRRQRKMWKQISLQEKSSNIANDSINRIVHEVTKSMDKVAAGNLSVKDDCSRWEPQTSNEPPHVREPR